ncbi:alpha/beta fold hydrolase [Halopelagius longus]|uniref:Alpha/beta fold hydrolase n=1 Tax=Halopelagius longus TaxID=1236180 RepID=A0A1H1AKS5_9EURY|nr:alpha/beta fold hydrolase [Halopelagius longus]RDI70410.1 alpha/beta fold hydrolase [Halopelagius longus]SDQ40091.1 Pimeloyl-ACP methyl ester carboxylesterase [Halopelagius longus]
MIQPATAPTDHGWLDGRLPYYRVGDGPETFVFVPGLNDAFDGTPNWRTAQVLGQAYREFTDEYTVWTVGRPRGLAPGTTTRDLAGSYATVLDELGGAHVVGYSMGGFIAQHLAADYPALVDRLVVGASADRLGERGVSLVERWRELAERGEWGRLYESITGETYVGWRKRVYSPVVRALGGSFAPSNPADVVVSCDACLEHDTGERLGEIDVPTLVVGGTEDPLFPESRLRATKEGIPGATLALLRGAGHAAMDENHDQFTGVVRRFLRDESL